MFENPITLSSKRIIRIFVFTALFFVLINILVGVFVPSFLETKRASEKLLSENVCNFSLNDFADINAMIANDRRKKIILLGDSIFYGIGVKEESQSVSGYLQKMLPDYSVYNLSSCGSKPLDYYFWLNRLKNENAIFIIQYNYKWFATDNGKIQDRVSQKRVLTEFGVYMDDEILKQMEGRASFLDKFGYFLAKNIPVVSNRTKLFALLLNEKSKEDFVKHLFFGKPRNKNLSYKQQYWRNKDEMKAFNCRISYSGRFWGDLDNFNLAIYRKTLKFINDNNLNAIVLLPSYNNELLKKCMKNSFDKNIAWFLDEADKNGVKAFSFVKDIDEKYFLDDMHLNASGNKRFVNLIFKQLK